MIVTRKFIQTLTIAFIVIGSAYIFYTSVMPVPKENIKLVESNQDWFKGAIMVIIGFYYISSPKSVVE